MASRTGTHGEEETARLCDRPDRQSMGADRTPHSRGGTGRASPQGQQPRVGQCDPLVPPSRDGLAAPSARSPALADGLLLSAALAARGGVGSGSPHPCDGRPRAGRARGEPDGCDPGQPIRSHGGSKRGSKGYDAGKKVKGRKRHILTDTDGRLLAIEVHGADIQDRDGAKGVLRRSRARFPFVERAYGDGGYAGRLGRWAERQTHILLEVVQRSTEQTGFAVIRRRWVVERTFAWIVKNRRFVRDYEQLTAVAETLITIAASATLIRRWP